MLGVLTSLVAAEPFDLLEACGLPQRTGRMVPRLTPFGIYESADSHVAICAPSEQFARGVFAAIGHPEFETDPRFASRDARVAHVDELNAHIEAFTRTVPTAVLVPLLEQHGVPAAEVRSPASAVRDPRVQARGETVPLDHPKFGHVADVIGMGVPITFSDAAAIPLRPAPSRRPGQRSRLWRVAGIWPGRRSRSCESTESSEIMTTTPIAVLTAAFEETIHKHGADWMRSTMLAASSFRGRLSRLKSFAPQDCVPIIARGGMSATPTADAYLEPGIFPGRLRSLAEAALTGRLSSAARIIVPRTSDPDYKFFLYLREFVRLGIASSACRRSCCSIFCSLRDLMFALTTRRASRDLLR